MAATAAEVQQTRIENIVPASWNVRTGHDVEGIAESIRVNGFRDPIEVWAVQDGETLDPPHVIVAGHGRYDAARKLGLDTVPVIEHEFDSIASAKRYSIANNRETDLSEFDFEGLSQALGELGDLEGTGFDLDDLAELRGHSEPYSEDEAVPEVQEETVSEPGDVWLCGDHRIVCGDCRDEEIVQKAINNAVVKLVATDPPYGVSYAEKARDMNSKGYGSRQSTMARDIDGDSEADAIELQRKAFQLALKHVDDHAAWYVWSSPGRGLYRLVAMMDELGCLYHQELVWLKAGFVPGRKDYQNRCEMCYYGWQTGSRPEFLGDRTETNVIEAGIDSPSERDHPTQKPVAVYDPAIRNHLRRGEVVYDPFLGSGTAMIAAEYLGRICCGIEYYPAYVDAAVRRWQRYTGRAAVRESDGFEMPDIDVESPE